MDLKGSSTEINLFFKFSFFKAQFSYFRIPYNTLCLPPKLLFSKLPLRSAYSQKYLKTISYSDVGPEGGGGQTECIIGDAKVVNSHPLPLEIENDVNFLKRCFW